MRYLSIFGVFGFLPIALSQSEVAPDNVVAYCKQKNGQIPQWSNGHWGCVQTSSICESDQDQSTLHEDSKTGEWTCCSKGQKLVDGTCKKPREQTPVIPTPQPGPGICGAHLKDAKLESLLRALLSQCFPHGTVSLDAFIQYYITILHGGIDLIEIIYKNGCDNPDPGPYPPNPPVHPWWKCPADNSASCRWLPLEVNKVRKNLPATSTQKVLPNPNVPISDYNYPFDTLVTKFSDDDLDIYIKDQKLQPQNSGTSYLIPAGTSGNDVYYKSPKGTSVQFYGACSEDTPCVGDEVVAWTPQAVTVAARDADIDVSSYDYPLVFTLADISVTTEQYTVRADGKEVGKTHGRLSLGDDKYNTKHIAKTTDVGGGPAGALRSIANDGFWGSFHIPKDTKKVTVSLAYEQPGWPNYIFEYRIDKLCKC